MGRTAKYNQAALSLPVLLTNIYLYLILGLFPLFVTNYYFNIQLSKFCFFVISTIVFLFLILFFGSLTRAGHRVGRRNQGRLSPFFFGACCLFGISAVASCVCSPWVEEAFWGASRYMGTLTLLCILIAFILIRRNFPYAPSVIYVFYICAAVVCIIGICQRFSFDPIGFYQNVPAKRQASYLSTLGQVHIFGSFLCMMIASVSAAFITARTFFRSVFCLPVILLGWMALICANSESAYLGILVLFLMLPWLLHGEARELFRYFLVLLLFWAAGAAIWGLGRLFPVRGGFSSFSVWAIRPLVFLPGMAVSALGALWFFLRSRQGGSGSVRNLIWRTLLLAALVCFVGLFVLAQFDSIRLPGVIRRAFTVTDTWGNSKGFIWRRAVSLFKELPLLRKLLGFGPDTVELISKTYWEKESMDTFGFLFDTARNDGLQYLLTQGILGLASWLSITGYAVWRTIHSCRTNPAILIFGCPVIAYTVQAFINVNQIITTPIWFIFVALTAFCPVETPAKRRRRR